MKILLCANHFGAIHNGPAKFANLLLEENERSGDPSIEIRILTEDPRPSKYDDDPRLYRTQFPSARGIPFSLLQLVRGWYYRRRLLQIAREYPFDLLVFNNVANALPADHGSSVPMIGLINDDNNLRAGAFRQRSLATYLSRSLLGKIESAAAHRVARVISNSDYLSELISSVYGIPPARISKMYKAVDLADIQYVERSFSSTDEIRLLFVKSDYRRGGLPDLIDALAKLPTYRFRLRAIGPPPELVGEYRKAGKIGQHIRFEVPGRMDQEGVFREMRDADIFCVPSRREALGVANIEAMAHGLPVVTTDSGGIPEVTDQGRNAWTAPAGNVQELARALEGCISRDEERRQRSAAALRYIQNNFTPLATYQRFLEISRQVLANRT